MTDDLQQARVEAAAKAMYELRAKIDDPFWEGGKLDYGIKQIYRQDARAALAAADAHLPSVEQIAEEIAGHPIGSGFYQTTVGVGEAREMAEAVRALFGEGAGDE